VVIVDIVRKNVRQLWKYLVIFYRRYEKFVVIDGLIEIEHTSYFDIEYIK